MGYPLKRAFAYQQLPEPAKWFDHCRSPPDLNSIHYNSLHVTVKDLLENVKRTAVFANKRGEDIKQRFVENSFNDTEFENGIKLFGKLDWLPTIPPASVEVLQQITDNDAFLKAHEFVQFYAVGIEQLLLDQILYGGTELMKSEYKDISDDNYKILCELNIGMHLQNLRPAVNVSRVVMSHEYRVIHDKAKRSFRDYLIIRDYVNATNFIAILFAHRIERLVIG